jgi:V/A-type H+-transporting ATPase subunit C
MSGRLGKYAFINAKLRTRISEILSEDFFDRLIRAPSLPEAIQLFRGTSFDFLESVYSQTGDIKMLELELLKREIYLYREIEGYLTGDIRSFILSLALYYEIYNLKNVLRLWFDSTVRGRAIGEAVGYIVRESILNPLPIDAILNADSMDQIIESLQETPYSDVLRKAAGRVESQESLFAAEIELDRFFYMQLLQNIQELVSKDREIARKIIGVEIDIQNVNWLIRFKSVYDLPLEEAIRCIIPQGRSMDEETARRIYTSENPSEMLSAFIKKIYPALLSTASSQSQDSASRFLLLEAVLNQILMQEVRRALQGYPFTIGTILAYFVLKKEEIKRILTLINAKNYELSEERIRRIL